MKRIRRFGAILLAVLLTIIPLCSTVATVHAAEPQGYIVMSIEKLTLGQGYIMEPQRVPYYSGETLAQVLDRILKDLGRDYEYTGSLTSGFYLSSIRDPNRASIQNTIPSYILDMWNSVKAAAPATKPIVYTDTNDPEYLGEYDYYGQSGWMYSVNNAFPPVGAGQTSAADGLVVRWQFSIIGLGGDLGGGGTTSAGTVTHMNRTELYTVMAAVRADKNLMADTKVRAAYDKALELSRDITVEKEALQEYLDVMKKALGDNQITELKLPDSDSGIRTYEYGTTLETASAGLPEYLVATVDGESKIITGVTWTLDSEFGAPGTYQFRPVLPEKYNRYTLTAELPMIKVTVRPPDGDVTEDAQLDVRDVSRMAASAGRTDRPLCDLDGSGATSWNDFRLLLNRLVDKALVVTDTPGAALSVAFDKETYQAGETATATIAAPEGMSFDTFSALLAYDTEKLTFQSVKLTEPMLETGILETEEGLQFGGASLEGALSGGAIATVAFTVHGDSSAEAVIVPEQTALLTSGYYLNVDASVMAVYAMTLEELKYGDLNGDGEINMDDAAMLIGYCNGVQELTEEQQAAAELNGDSVLNIEDAVLLIKYCNNVISRFPVEINEAKSMSGGE